MIKAIVLTDHWAKEMMEADMVDNLLAIAGPESRLRRMFELNRRETCPKTAYNSVIKEARDRTLEYWYYTDRERASIPIKLVYE